MKTVLLTGATGDIGISIAHLFAQNGYNLALVYNNSEKKAKTLQNELSKFNVKVSIYQCDLSINLEVKELINNVLKDFSRVDILINNAGISEQMLFQDINEDIWDNMINVNLKSVYNTCYYIVPFMISNKFGKIINISSVWGMVGASCEVHYSTSKSAIIGFTKALSKELAISNINVNCIAPGAIIGSMNSHLSVDEMKLLSEDIPNGNFGKPIDVANTALFLGNPTGDYYYGQILSPNGGLVI